MACGPPGRFSASSQTFADQGARKSARNILPAPGVINQSRLLEESGDARMRSPGGRIFPKSVGACWYIDLDELTIQRKT